MVEESRRPRDTEPSGSGAGAKIGRGALQALGGAIPFIGGLLSAAANYWSEYEQEQVNSFLRSWLGMLEDELREKQTVIGEIIVRLDMHDDEIKARVRSEEYQTLLRRVFRNWAGVESAKKQEYIRNILTNAASVRVVSDDVLMLFIEWLQKYSEFHFAIIADIYHHSGTTRASIWNRLGKGHVREDSADADLFKVLIRDLSTGAVIRQHRETDYAGNFVPKQRSKSRSSASRALKSAFDDSEQYELTALGRQFVHYAMTETSVKIEYQYGKEEAESSCSIDQEAKNVAAQQRF